MVVFILFKKTKQKVFLFIYVSFNSINYIFIFFNGILEIKLKGVLYKDEILLLKIILYVVVNSLNRRLGF